VNIVRQIFGFWFILLSGQFVYAQPYAPPLEYNEQVVADSKELSRLNNEIGMTLFDRLRSDYGNFVFSPFSVNIAISVARIGAKGDTARQIAKTLQVSPMATNSLELLNSELYLLTNFSTVESEFKMLNSVWVRSDVPVLASYMRVATGDYHAKVSRFTSTNSRIAFLDLNGWLNGPQPWTYEDVRPFKNLNDSTKLVYSAAISFKAPWLQTFVKASTRNAVFYTATNGSVFVPTMQSLCRYSFSENEDWRLLEIPLFSYPEQLEILIPKSGQGLDDSHNVLTTYSLEELIRTCTNDLGLVSIPRFGIESRFDLGKVLSEIGMSGAFIEKEADLSALSQVKPIAISALLHGASISVDEAGVETAAESLSYNRGPFPELPKGTNFKVDRPFVLIIRDNVSGTILFMGQVVNPALH
jgi:serpin B